MNTINLNLKKIDYIYHLADIHFPKNISTLSLEAKLRAGKNPVVGRISEEKLILDMRTVLEDEIDILAQKLIDILK